MELEKKHNNSHHHHNHHKPSVKGYYPRDEQLFWVVLAFFAVIPLGLLILKIQRKISERCKSQREQNRSSGRRSSCQVSESNCVTDVEISVYSITKQDYKNLAPPRYSAIYLHPTPVTYVEPPPYSPAIR